MNAHEIVAIDIIPIELPLIEPFIISYGAAAKVESTMRSTSARSASPMGRPVA